MKEEYARWFDRQAGLIQGMKEHTADMYDMLEDGVEPPPPPPPPPRKDKPWWPNRYNTKGVTAFPLSVRPKEYIVDLCEYLIEFGYNTISAGAQAWSPAQAARYPILPASPPVGSPAWAKNLENLLESTARFEDMSLQLTPTFGHKQHDASPDSAVLAWHILHARRIIEIIKAGDYKHVFINLFNEFKHPLTSRKMDDKSVVRLGDVFREAGFKITSDHGGTEKDNVTGDRIWRAYYPKAWLGFNMYSWHPTRNPPPTSNQFRKAHIRWPGIALLFSETECFASDADMAKWPDLRGKGTIAGEGKVNGEAQKWLIRRLKQRIKNAGHRSRFFFHSIWLGIRGGLDTLHGWLPEY